MDRATYIDALTDQGNLLIDAISAVPDGPITHCGDWTNRGLAAHIGMVWTIAAGNVLAATTEPTKPGDERKPPADPDELIGWLQGRHQTVIEALRGAEPNALSWAFDPDDQTAGFWQRRMAHETTVHRVDAQHGATGSADPIDAALAADGIDEYTAVGLRYSSARPDRTYPSQSLHLHCTDTEGEWMLVGDDGPNVTVTHEHGKGDAAVRGRAEDLLLWIWGRPSGDVEIFGDPDVATTWRSLAP